MKLRRTVGDELLFREENERIMKGKNSRTNWLKLGFRKNETELLN
jgi:hypothetical protein